MKTDELRQKYLEFFVSKGHTLLPSDVLVPKWDSTVLFTPAGMNQFKDHFMGKVELEFTRATTCQKCLRTGDIDNVGRTAYHHTFFEMLGNFSFGDYFKREAIIWAWEFLTGQRWLGLDSSRLTVSVYLDDEEAAEIWRKDVGLSAERIQRMDEYENFWPAGAPSDGPDGVCGPCSEIFYHPGGGPEVEIWNLVFTQFNRIGAPPDNLHPLPSKNIDTGMGLERAAAVLQGVDTNYHIDILYPLVQRAAEVCHTPYVPQGDSGRRLRRIADHIRACSFAIHENVLPDKEKENYVVRRLLRRAVLDGYQMGLHEPFLFQLVDKVAELMSEPYPELQQTISRVQETIKGEEAGFLHIIENGVRRVQPLLDQLKRDNQQLVPGRDVAELYQTHGIPPELVEAMALNQQFQFDWDGYQRAMQEHGDVSRTETGVMGDFGPVDRIKKRLKKTGFVGYEQTRFNSTIVAMAAGDDEVESLNCENARNPSDQPATSAFVVLKETPFYAESGGQVGDTGEIQTETGTFSVTDTQKNGDVITHFGYVTQGELKRDQQAVAQVDALRRDAIRRAHSATHILHHALQHNLGQHAQQQGSKVDVDWLRFDFSNPQPVSPEQLEAIERLSEARIRERAPVKAEIVPMEQARQAGAMMLFGEKYPDPVRMVSIGEFSKELCGGTHLQDSGEVGPFEITGEEAVSAGTRRITALTGQKAQQYQQHVVAVASKAAELLRCRVADIPQRTQALFELLKQTRKVVAAGTGALPENLPDNRETTDRNLKYPEIRHLVQETARSINASILELDQRIPGMQEELTRLREEFAQMQDAPAVDANSLLDGAETVEGIALVTHEMPGANPNIMRKLVDQVRKKHQPSAIFLAGAAGDKVVLIAALTKDLVEKGFRAGDWVKQVAPIVGGGGGGKPDMAQAGGKLPEKIPQALEAARAFIRQASATTRT